MRNTLFKPLLVLLCFGLIHATTQNTFGQTFSIVGSGTASNGNQAYPAPFGNYYWGARHQFFVTAAQLTTAGVAANSSVSSLGFNVLNTNSAGAHDNFIIKVYTTTATNPISAGYVTTGLVAETSPINHTPATGWNQFNFITPFVWNGTDNLVIETCFNSGGFTLNASTEWTASGLGTGTWSRWRRADNATVCGNTNTTNTSTTTRPNMRFGWTSNVACSGTPNAGTAALNLTSGCTGQSLTLTATGVSTGLGISYQWQSGPSASGPWTNISGGTTTVLNTTSVAGTTFYRLVTTCSNSGESNNTANNISFNNTGGTSCGGICPINIPSVPVTNQALSCNATAMPGALNATNVPQSVEVQRTSTKVVKMRSTLSHQQ